MIFFKYIYIHITLKMSFNSVNNMNSSIYQFILGDIAEVFDINFNRFFPIHEKRILNKIFFHLNAIFNYLRMYDKARFKFKYSSSWNLNLDVWVNFRSQNVFITHANSAFWSPSEIHFIFLHDIRIIFKSLWNPLYSAYVSALLFWKWIN